MHRAPDPPVRSFFDRWGSILLGAVVTVALVAAAVVIRFSGDSAADMAVGDGAAETQAREVSSPDEAEPLSTSVSSLPSQSAASTTTPPVPTSGATPSTGAESDGELGGAGGLDVGPDGTAPSVASPEPTYGGAVRVGVVGAPRSLNPLGLDGARESVVALRHAVTTGAIRLDPETRNPAAVAVEDVPSIENGGLEVIESGELVVRLTIRGDAVWSDGTPITFDDFSQTYAVASQASGVPPEVRERYGRITPGSLSGEGKTVEYRLRTPGVDYVDLFDVLVPAHEVELAGFSANWDDTMWSAGGAFRFFGFDADTSTLTLVANQRSWHVDAESGDPLPYLDRLDFVYYPTLDDLLAAIRAGEVDVGRVGGDPAVIGGFAADSEFLLDVRRGPGWEQMGFQLGAGRGEVNPDSLLGDVVVRRAVATAIDRLALVDAVQGSFGVPLGSITSTSWELNPGEDPWSVFDGDPTESVALLTGLADRADTPPVLSFATTSNDSDREELARMLIETLEPLGFTVEVTRTEPGAHFFDFVIPGAFETAAWAWESAPGPLGALDDFRDRHVLDWPNGTDFYHWGESGDPDFGAFAGLLDEVTTEVELENVRAGLGDLEASLADSVTLLPLYADLNGAVARADAVGGFRHSILPGGHLAGVAGWWRIESG